DVAARRSVVPGARNDGRADRPGARARSVPSTRDRPHARTARRCRSRLSGSGPVTLSQLEALLPILIVAATAVVVMLGIAAKRIHRMAAGLTVAGLAIALAVLMPSFLTGDQSVVAVTDLIVVDAKARLGMVLVLVTTLGVFTLCPAYFDGYRGNREEIYLLLAIATLGALTLTCAYHAATLLIGLEIGR